MIRARLLMILLVIPLVNSSFVSPAARVQARQPVASWTFMVYMAGDNNLESFALSDLNEMEVAGSTPDVNVVVQLDRSDQYDTSSEDWSEARRFLVTHDLRRTRIGSEQVGAPGEINTGDPAPLAEFAIWAMTSYPAEHYALVMWDHGGSWQGLAADESAGGDELTLPELDEALRQVTETTGVDKLDLIGFDACLMGAFEVYRTIAPYGLYAVGSPELIPGNGWDYRGALDALNADPALDGAAFGWVVVDQFIAFYSEVVSHYPIFSLGLIDLSQTEPVARQLQLFSDTAASAGMVDPVAAASSISRARTHTPVFGAFGDPLTLDTWAATDLFQFMRVLADQAVDPALRSAAQDVFDAGQRMILYFRSNDSAPEQAGVSIFFPRTLSLYEEHNRAARYSAELPSSLTPWPQFLRTFYTTAAAASETVGAFVVDLIRLRPIAGGLEIELALANATWSSVYILYEVGPGNQIIVDSLPVEPAPLALASQPAQQGVLLRRVLMPITTVTWPGQVYWLDGVAGEVPVFMRRDPDTPTLGIVNGQVSQTTGSPVDALMVFDLTTMQAISLWGMSPSAGTLMPAELDPGAWGIFVPSWLSLGPDGQILTAPAPTQIALSGWPPVAAFRPADAGSYAAVLRGEDVAGTLQEDQEHFKADGQGGFLTPDDSGTPPDVDGESRGDVYDYELTQPVSGAGAEYADLDRVSAWYGGAAFMPDGTVIHPEPNEWQRLFGAPVIIPPGQDSVALSGQGTEQFMSDGRMVSITTEGAWSAEFSYAHDEPGTLFHFESSAQYAVQDVSPGWYQFQTDYYGDGRMFGLSGAHGLVEFNAEARTIDVVLLEGLAVLLPPISRDFPALSGDPVLWLHMNESGEVEQRTMPLANALAMFPPGFDSLSFQIDMVHPIADGPDEAQQVWHVLLDLDGNPATGFSPGRQMYTGLGIEFGVAVMYGEGDQFHVVPEISTSPDPAPLDIPVWLSADRRTMIVYLPTALLEQAAAEQGTSLNLVGMHWRVAAVNYSADVAPKDVFPELVAGAGSMSGPSSPESPSGASVSMSVSVSGGGPVAVFEDRSTSPDPDMAIVGRLWDFGDGTTSTEPNPQHSYEQPGEYTVTLTVTFANGSTLAGPIPVTITVGSGVPATSGMDESVPAESCTTTALQNANLRGGPGTTFDVVGTVSGGDSLTVIGQNGAQDWYRLRVDGLDAAWIAGFLVNAPVCPAGLTLPVSE